MQVPCSSAQEASFLGKPIPVQGHACFTERSTIHPRAFLFPKWNREVKSYQVADTPLLAAGSQHQQLLSPAVPQKKLSIHHHPLPGTNCPGSSRGAALSDIHFPALCVPGRNRLHKEGQSCRHTTVTPCLHCRAGHRLGPQRIWGVPTADERFSTSRTPPGASLLEGR